MLKLIAQQHGSQKPSCSTSSNEPSQSPASKKPLAASNEPIPSRKEPTPLSQDQSLQFWKEKDEDNLIELRHMKHDDFLRTRNHLHLQEEIATQLKEVGCEVTQFQANNKYNALKKKWKEIIDAPSGTEAKYFRHKVAFDNVYGHKASTKPMFALDTLWSCQNVCDALSNLLDNIYIRFGTKLYRQIVGIPMGTNCAPLVADLFLYCYERDFMDSLNHNNQADVIEAFNSTSRYLDDLLNIDNPYFEGMVNQIYPPELQLNKANTSDTEAPFLDLHLSAANGFVSSKIYDERDDFDFDIVNFPFLDGDVIRRASYGVYISQLIRFARVCNHVTDFNVRNKCLTAQLLQQGYRYHKLRKTFSKFYRRHYELISKYNVGLKTLLSERLSEPEFYGDFIYKFRKLKGINDFSFQFSKNHTTLQTYRL